MALALREWLPVMFSGLTAFVSSEDIDKGARWASELDAELDETHFGIMFLTPDNLEAPWLLYEAGALAKSVAQGRCACVLHQVSKASLKYPLARFQATALKRDDLLLLMKAVNKELGQHGQGERELEHRFDALWPDLEAALANIAKTEVPEAPPPIRSERDLLEELLAAVRLLTESVAAAATQPSTEAAGADEPVVPPIPPGWRRRATE